MSSGASPAARDYVAEDLDDLTDAFERAIAAQLLVGDRAQIGRTRLLYGMRLRRMGARSRAAREQLRRAVDDFAAVELQAWKDRADANSPRPGNAPARGNVLKSLRSARRKPGWRCSSPAG